MKSKKHARAYVPRIKVMTHLSTRRFMEMAREVILLELMVLSLTISATRALPCSTEQSGQITLWNVSVVNNTIMGSLLVCKGGLWSSTCDHDWTSANACEQLGYSETVPTCNSAGNQVTDCHQPTPNVTGECGDGGVSVICLINLRQVPTPSCTCSEEPMSPLLAVMIGAVGTLVVILLVGVVMVIIARTWVAVQEKKTNVWFGELEKDKPEKRSGRDVQKSRDLELMVSNQAYATSLTVAPTAETENYVEMAPAGSLARSCPPAPAQVQDNLVTSHTEKIYDVCP